MRKQIHPIIHLAVLFGACNEPITSNENRLIPNEMLAPIEETELFVWDLEISSDGDRLITTGTEGVIAWNPNAGTMLAALDTAEDFNDSEISSDGSLIATTSNEGLKLWGASDGLPLAVLAENMSGDLEFSQDGALLASVSTTQQTTTLWDVKTKKLLFVLPQDRSVTSVEFSPDGSRLLTKSYNSLILWDTKTGEKITKINEQRKKLFSTNFTPDGRTIITRVKEENRTTTHFWNAKTGAHGLKYSSTFQDYRDKEEMSADETLSLLTTKDAGSVALLNTKTEESTSAETPSKHTPAKFIKFSPTGEYLAKVLHDGTVQLWRRSGIHASLQTNEEIHEILFSPDGTKLFVANDRGATVWSVETGALLHSLVYPSPKL
jgi:WD40 repeat protein